jgi:hypothetical protein
MFAFDKIGMNAISQQMYKPVSVINNVIIFVSVEIGWMRIATSTENKSQLA